MTTTIPINLTIPNVNDLLSIYDQVKVYRAPSDDSSLAVEITNSATRIVLQINQTKYQYLDLAGDLSYYYATSFYNTTTQQESPLGPLRSGSGDPAFDVVSIDELKNIFLIGIPQADPTTGVAFPNSFYAYWIKAAVSELETRLMIPLRPRVIVAEPHDFYTNDYQQLNQIKLTYRPLISIEALRVMNGSLPVANIPLAWIQAKREAGRFQVLPTTAIATSSLVLSGGVSYYTIFGPPTGQLPNIFEVDYTAGFTKGNVPPELKRLAGMMASIGPLQTIGDIIFGPGLSGNKIALDALMTNSLTTKSSKGGAFTGTVLQRQAEIEQLIKVYEVKYSGIGFAVA